MRPQAARELLGRIGEPEPERAAQALAQAARHPDLASTATRWAPGLLRSARPGFAAQCLVDLAERHRTGRGMRLDPLRTPLLPLLLGSSNFLARLLVRDPDWLEDLVGDPPGPPPGRVPPPDWEAIRRAKYHGLLRVAARDLAGRSFAEGLRELSDLADRCLVAALRAAAEQTAVAPPALFALGKLGGRELNFSSDVDLLFVYEAPLGQADLARNHEVARLVRCLREGLERPTAEGFAYRVDLDLRPEGPTGALANSVHGALDYYENFGAEWERQALIRLRHVAGSEAAARAFEADTQPFVYRRAIGPEVLRAVRDMKIRIETERRQAGRDIDVDLKEGAGGIRDVEFLVQALQLFYGGRERGLRTGNVLEALAGLERLRIVPAATVAALRDAYLWLRRAEHALQLADERQTQSFPREPAAQLAQARRMGYADPSGEHARARLLEDWTAVRGEVRAHFEALVLEPGSDVDA